MTGAYSSVLRAWWFSSSLSGPRSRVVETCRNQNARTVDITIVVTRWGQRAIRIGAKTSPKWRVQPSAIGWCWESWSLGRAAKSYPGPPNIFPLICPISHPLTCGRGELNLPYFIVQVVLCQKIYPLQNSLPVPAGKFLLKMQVVGPARKTHCSFLPHIHSIHQQKGRKLVPWATSVNWDAGILYSALAALVLSLSSKNTCRI